jgi:hypothetical protein
MRTAYNEEMSHLKCLSKIEEDFEFDIWLILYQPNIKMFSDIQMFIKIPSPLYPEAPHFA